VKILKADERIDVQAGQRVGVSRQAINAVETGKFNPSFPLAMKLARIFTQSVEEIFSLEDVT